MHGLKFALIGCGRIAQKHAEHMANHGKLVAVCDTVSENRDALAKKYSCKAYDSIEKLIAAEKKIDLVAVCTPNGLHAKHSIALLKTGFNVLCEKPMAITVKDCEKMIKAADTTKKHLFIVKQNRFNLPIAELKKVIDEGRLGKIFNVQLNCFWNRNDAYYNTSDWKGSKELDGGTLFTQFSHFIDLLYWMVGDIKKAHLLTGNFMHKKNIDFEDTGVIALKFTNGALGTVNYTVNSFAKNMEGSITVFGEKGTVKVGGQYLNVLEYQSIENYTMQAVTELKPANDYGFYQGSMSNHDKVYENIVDVLTKNGSIATNGAEGLKTVEIIENIYNSVKKKNKISLQNS
ncbi:MAG TPA: Gfo/Idh/MocA family oxidoreductase [Bacteroidia bacterium]|jgi:UDP-N-acetyl-2-amino-2-deoxyglucuronate dehydrogenase|nr:Gfo/Idh/MocA family oxidoreductase [Bacteroidia bacterium]